MPNRIIKESICYSDDIDSLSSFAETVFYRLLVRVDDYGRIDARPSFLKSMLFVTKNGVSEKNVSEAVAQLASLGLVRLYKVDGKPFLCLPKWHLHQRIRDSKEKYPAPPENADFSNSPQLAATRRELPPKSQSNPNPNPESKTPTADAIDTFFENVWSLYPNKKGKTAVKPSTREKLYKLGYEKLSLAISRYKQEIEAFATDPQYVKHGSTFFNGAYKDYLADDWKPPKSKGQQSNMPSYYMELEE